MDLPLTAKQSLICNLNEYCFQRMLFYLPNARHLRNLFLTGNQMLIWRLREWVREISITFSYDDLEYKKRRVFKIPPLVYSLQSLKSMKLVVSEATATFSGVRRFWGFDDKDDDDNHSGIWHDKLMPEYFLYRTDDFLLRLSHLQHLAKLRLDCILDASHFAPARQSRIQMSNLQSLTVIVANPRDDIDARFPFQLEASPSLVDLNIMIIPPHILSSPSALRGDSILQLVEPDVVSTIDAERNWCHDFWCKFVLGVQLPTLLRFSLCISVDDISVDDVDPFNVKDGVILNFENMPILHSLLLQTTPLLSKTTRNIPQSLKVFVTTRSYRVAMQSLERIEETSPLLHMICQLPPSIESFGLRCIPSVDEMRTHRRGVKICRGNAPFLEILSAMRLVFLKCKHLLHINCVTESLGYIEQTVTYGSRFMPNREGYVDEEDYMDEPESLDRYCALIQPEEIPETLLSTSTFLAAYFTELPPVNVVLKSPGSVGLKFDSGTNKDVGGRIPPRYATIIPSNESREVDVKVEMLCENGAVLRRLRRGEDLLVPEGVKHLELNTRRMRLRYIGRPRGGDDDVAVSDNEDNEDGSMSNSSGSESDYDYDASTDEDDDGSNSDNDNGMAYLRRIIDAKLADVGIVLPREVVGAETPLRGTVHRGQVVLPASLTRLSISAMSLASIPIDAKQCKMLRCLELQCDVYRNANRRGDRRNNPSAAAPFFSTPPTVTFLSISRVTGNIFRLPMLFPRSIRTLRLMNMSLDGPRENGDINFDRLALFQRTASVGTRLIDAFSAFPGFIPNLYVGFTSMSAEAQFAMIENLNEAMPRHLRHLEIDYLEVRRVVRRGGRRGVIPPDPSIVESILRTLKSFVKSRQGTLQKFILEAEIGTFVYDIDNPVWQAGADVIPIM